MGEPMTEAGKALLAELAFMHDEALDSILAIEAEAAVPATPSLDALADRVSRWPKTKTGKRLAACPGSLRLGGEQERLPDGSLTELRIMTPAEIACAIEDEAQSMRFLRAEAAVPATPSLDAVVMERALRRIAYSQESDLSVYAKFAERTAKEALGESAARLQSGEPG